MFFGDFPYGARAESCDQMKAAILAGGEPSFTCSAKRSGSKNEAGVPNCAIEFIQQMMERSPKLRSSASAVLAHEFVSAFSSEVTGYSSEESTTSLEFKSSINMARTRRRDWKEDGIVETDLDDLLARLQQ